MKKILFYFSLAVIATSCISKYDVTLPNVEKTLVVNSFLSNDTTELAVLQVSQAVGVLSNDWKLPDTANAVVEIFENGVKLQRLQNVSNDPRYYQAQFVPYQLTNFRPKAGRTYKISVKMRSFDAITAEQVMPNDPPTFTAVFRDSLGVISGGPFGGDNQPISGASISFTDNAATENYYEVTAYTQDSIDLDNDGHLDIINTYLNPADIASGNTLLESSSDRSYRSSLLLADQTINGQRISFDILSRNMDENIRFENNVSVKTAKRWIRLSHITKDRYLYLKSIKKQVEASNSPFAEPVYVFSNLTSKFGIFMLANGRLRLCD